MVAPGFFVVHDAVRPPLTDGDYRLHVSQTLSADQSSVEPATRSFRLVGPRYTLPVDQVLSMFPPRDAAGAFADRLPQIVLRRRTLPYERRMKPDDPPPAAPWLALVVLADGEGQLLTGQPLDGSLPEQDDKDAPVRDVLRVSERVVQAVFPTIEDLPWLTHVREVDLADTELALGDDDGWLAVVVSNRLPVLGPPDTGGGPPAARHYTAFLVSLEGHEDDLPSVETLDQPQFGFATSHVYSDVEITAAAATAARAQRSPLQASIPAESLGTDAARGTATPAPGERRGSAAAKPGGLGAANASLTGRTAAAAQPAHPADAWSASPAAGNFAAASAAAASTAAGGGTGAAALKGLSIDPVWYDPLARIVDFTVLTYWSFTSQPDGDFGWLMQHLDIGMLGTAPKGPPPGSKPPALDSRPPLQVLDTGHLVLSATSRRGEPGSVWYRGPFTPRAILRPAPGDPDGVLAHAADQLRRVGPDGLENVSLAIAFEIGRMLAAAQPGVAAALLNWRRDGYGQARLGAILASGTTPLHQLLAADLAKARPVFSAGVVAGVLSDLGAGNGGSLGPTRPLVDPAPVKGAGEELAAVVARGFGLDGGQVAAVLGRGGSGPAAVPGVPAGVTQPTAPQDFRELTPGDFAGARLGLQSQVLGILGTARRSPAEAVRAGDAAPADQPEGHQS
jgi:hypothetical protein